MVKGLYCIKIGGEWFIARPIKATEYGDLGKHLDEEIPEYVWQEAKTTALLWGTVESARFLEHEETSK